MEKCREGEKSLPLSSQRAVYFPEFSAIINSIFIGTAPIGVFPMNNPLRGMTGCLNIRANIPAEDHRTARGVLRRRIKKSQQRSTQSREDKIAGADIIRHRPHDE